MNPELNKSMPFAGLTVGQVTEMLEELLAKEARPMPMTPEVIGIEEVADITGYTVKTLYKLVHEKKIPYHKPQHGGRRLFFITAEIYDWLKSNRVETNDEWVRNHRKGKPRRPDKWVWAIQTYMQNVRKQRMLCELLMLMYAYQELSNKALENQIAQYELQIENLTKNQ